MTAHPQERRLILKHADDPTYSNQIGCYLREGGYEILKKAGEGPAFLPV